jgi:hypothetical protein
MKKYMIAFCALIVVVMLTNCSKDETKDYYSVLGIIRITTDSVIIETDLNKRLLVENKNALGTSIKDKDRVIAYFTITDKTTPTGIDYIINLENLQKVLFKPIIELTDQNADSIGNNEITVNNLWLEKNFLNLDFLFYGGNVSHSINLIRYSGAIRTDTVTLEIRHNNKNDNGLTYLNGFVTFDLTSIKNNVTDSVIVCIKAKEYDNRTYKKYFSYKF